MLGPVQGAPRCCVVPAPRPALTGARTDTLPPATGPESVQPVPVGPVLHPHLHILPVGGGHRRLRLLPAHSRTACHVRTVTVGQANAWSHRVWLTGRRGSLLAAGTTSVWLCSGAVGCLSRRMPFTGRLLPESRVPCTPQFGWTTPAPRLARDSAACASAQVRKHQEPDGARE